MNSKLPQSYRQSIASRTTWHYLKGWLIRWWTNLRYAFIRSLARKANENLVVGSHVSIQTDKLDLRNPIHIGSNVIIGAETEIITTSHNIDSPEFGQKDYGITIDDYVWISGKVTIVPSCRHIGQGAVVGTGSIVVHNVEPMSVVGGNPAQEFKKRTSLHTDLVVESLLGGDFDAYREARNG